MKVIINDPLMTKKVRLPNGFIFKKPNPRAIPIGSGMYIMHSTVAEAFKKRESENG